MKTLIRWIAGLLGAVLLLSIALSLAVMFLFDPNDYKDDIAALVSEQTGRSFSIDGDLSLQAFPCCGVALGPLTLGNPPGFPEEPFAQVGRAVVDLQLWPLLMRREVRIGTVELQGLDAQLISRKDGTTNWEFKSDKAGEPEAPSDTTSSALPSDLAIVGIAIRNGRLGYNDAATGKVLTFSDINLTTGTIRPGKPFDLDASVAAFGLVEDARAELQLKAQLQLDSATQRLDVTQLNGDIRLTGGNLPGGDVDVALELGAARGVGGERVMLEQLVARVKAAGLNLTVSGDGALVNNAPELSGTLVVDLFSPAQLLKTLGKEPIVTQDKAVLQRAELQGNLTYAGDQVTLTEIISSLDDTQIRGWVGAESIDKQQLEFDLKLDAIDLERYSAPADSTTSTTDLKAASGKPATSEPAFGLPLEQLRKLNMDGRIAIGNLKTADAELSDVLVTLSAHQGQVRLNPLNAKFDGSSFAGDVRLDATGSQPKLAFDMQVDSLNLDRYIQPASETEAGSGNKTAAAGNTSVSGDESLDLPVAELRQLYLDGRINAGKLQFSNAQLSDVRININARDGVIRLHPLTANLYGGNYAGDMRLDVTGSKPQLSVNEKLAGVQLGALLQDASKIRNLEGLSDARVTATATGDTVNELLGNLKGDAVLDLQQGVFHGVDLWYEIRKARALLKQEAPPPVPADPFTDISKLGGTAKFANGVITNNDFLAEASYLGINGKGTVSLLESTLDYRLEAKIIGTPTFDDGKKLSDMQGQVLPVTIRGKLASPSVRVEVGAMALDMGKRKLMERLGKKLGIEQPAAPADKSSGPATTSAADSATNPAEASGDAANAAPDPETPAQEQAEPKPADPKEQLKKELFKILGN